MKKVEFEIGPSGFLESALPWLLKRYSMYVDVSIIGMWAFGIPDEYGGLVIETEEQYKEFFSEYTWETQIVLPALSENMPVRNEEDFIKSPYQIYVFYYDGNYLIAYFKDDALADEYEAHLKAGTVIFKRKEKNGSLTAEDASGYSIW